MLSIQDVGLEILNKNPRKFYVFLGNEYGIKLKYINLIANHYQSDVTSVDSVSSILSFMNTKHLIPLTPKVYVIHYDEGFLSDLNKSTSMLIDSTNIVGTVVCIYDSENATKKFGSNLPDYSVIINSVDIKFMKKYLISDFPNIPESTIERIATISNDYYSAYNTCKCIDVSKLYNLSYNDIDTTFKHDFEATDTAVRHSIANRNFRQVLESYKSYTGTPDMFIYTIFNVLLELEKLICNKYATSDLRDYVKKWKLPDIYNMFNQSYRMLVKLRTISIDVDNAVVYLASLLLYSDVPSIEEM